MQTNLTNDFFANNILYAFMITKCFFLCPPSPTDVPQITLRLGSNLRHSHIQEGNDVYFECIIRASPSVSEIRWHFEGRELQTNTSAGVIVSNQSLVLQKVKRNQRGRYTCSATNEEGEGESNAIHLRVQFAPVCKTGTYFFTFLESSSFLLVDKTKHLAY